MRPKDQPALVSPLLFRHESTGDETMFSDESTRARLRPVIGPPSAQRKNVAVEISIRRAGGADRVAIEQLDPLAHSGDIERITQIREAVARGHCLIAEGGQIVGLVVTAPKHFFGRDFVELIVVDDHHRRRGVGRALLRAAVDRAATTRVFSSTNESNGAMQSLFTTDGWTLSGRLNGLDLGDPEIVFFIDRLAEH